ncbi:hypothetical protein DPEC_G00180950 [Dallia pectoralis]|uniref:Uncharacterized protein n=1 Tax=Dallia pectoralis TaxID=75939 RepID=A0ACC2GAL1_DALPE|nr:hypothetical protein DPEC_G00180950 [Dallia pectoralis]
MGNVSMLVVCVAVIFSLVSVSQTAPVSQTCEELLKPLEMKTTDPLKGKWSVVATSNNQPGAKTLNTVLITNIWWDIVPGTQDNMVDAIIYTKMYGECSSKIFNISAENNNLSWIYIVPSTAVFLPTCADCLLIQTTTTINGNTYTSLDLASKRRVLNDAELVQFTTQLDCLNMPSKVVFNPKMGLCPEISGPTPDPEELYRALVNFMEMDLLADKGHKPGMLEKTTASH